MLKKVFAEKSDKVLKIIVSKLINKLIVTDRNKDNNISSNLKNILSYL